MGVKGGENMLRMASRRHLLVKEVLQLISGMPARCITVARLMKCSGIGNRSANRYALSLPTENRLAALAGQRTGPGAA